MLSLSTKVLPEVVYNPVSRDTLIDNVKNLLGNNWKVINNSYSETDVIELKYVGEGNPPPYNENLKKYISETKMQIENDGYEYPLILNTYKMGGVGFVVKISIDIYKMKRDL